MHPNNLIVRNTTKKFMCEELILLAFWLFLLLLFRLEKRRVMRELMSIKFAAVWWTSWYECGLRRIAKIFDERVFHNKNFLSRFSDWKFFEHVFLIKKILFYLMKNFLAHFSIWKTFELLFDEKLLMKLWSAWDLIQFLRTYLSKIISLLF